MSPVMIQDGVDPAIPEAVANYTPQATTDAHQLGEWIKLRQQLQAVQAVFRPYHRQASLLSVYR